MFTKINVKMVSTILILTVNGLYTKLSLLLTSSTLLRSALTSLRRQELTRISLPSVWTTLQARSFLILPQLLVWYGLKTSRFTGSNASELSTFIDLHNHWTSFWDVFSRNTPRRDRMTSLASQDSFSTLSTPVTSMLVHGCILEAENNAQIHLSPTALNHGSTRMILRINHITQDTFSHSIGSLRLLPR